MMKKFVIGILTFLVLLGGLYYIDNNFVKNLVLEEDHPPPTEEGQWVSKENNQQSNQPEIGIRRGNIAADFTLVNLDGVEESLWDYHGKRVILNFWASDCPACRQEMPDLNQFYLENQDNDIIVLGVNLGENINIAKNFMRENNYQFPSLVDEKVQVGFSYGVMFLPTTYFINEEGVIEDLHIGVLTLEDLNKRYQ